MPCCVSGTRLEEPCYFCRRQFRDIAASRVETAGLTLLVLLLLALSVPVPAEGGEPVRFHITDLAQPADAPNDAQPIIADLVLRNRREQHPLLGNVGRVAHSGPALPQRVDRHRARGVGGLSRSDSSRQTCLHVLDALACQGFDSRFVVEHLDRDPTSVVYLLERR